MINSRRARRGFTMIELMMSLAILAVGVSGIIAMQKVTAMSNLHAKSVTVATQVANSWQDQLLVDATLWTNTAGISSTTWLKDITSKQNVWFRPSYDSARQFGAGFDGLGNPVSDAQLARTQFCVHLLLAPATSIGPDNPGNGVIRATVRVLWPRVQSTRQGAHFCADGEIESIGNDLANFHFVYQTLALRVTP
ncbi:MAG TPA: prepilin-type N-terminal cleavage/methylation domain-containing protein [Polyangiaceae bacterium]|nr:prepilin-type N-terminal cleavage/methylation domain-containing protein [Polyangiaceae bacterium]